MALEGRPREEASRRASPKPVNAMARAVMGCTDGDHRGGSTLLIDSATSQPPKTIFACVLKTLVQPDWHTIRSCARQHHLEAIVSTRPIANRSRPERSTSCGRYLASAAFFAGAGRPASFVTVTAPAYRASLAAKSTCQVPGCSVPSLQGPRCSCWRCCRPCTPRAHLLRRNARLRQSQRRQRQERLHPSWAHVPFAGLGTSLWGSVHQTVFSAQSIWSMEN